MSGALRIELTFHGYWHCGNGQGLGAAVDRAVIRDRDNLPYVPGRSLKGALREAATRCAEAGLLADAEVEALFGSAIGDGDVEGENGIPARFETSPAGLRIGDARMVERDRQALLALDRDRRAPLVAALYAVLPQTAIDEETGTAKDHSLRTTEVAIPMVLEAPMAILEGSGDSARNQLHLVLPMLRTLGLMRHRGLGRVTARLREAENG